MFTIRIMYATDSILTFSFPMGQWLGARFRFSFLMPVVLLALMWRLQSPGWGLLAGLIILYSILLHEIAHVIVARINGGDAEEIIIWPLGGLIPVLPGIGPSAALSTFAAGPLANLIVACFCMYPLYFSGDLMPLLNPFAEFTILENHSVAETSLRMAFLVNWSLALLNLLPVLPMDGGHYLRSFLSGRYSDSETLDILLRFGLAGSMVGVLAGFVLNVSGVVALSAFVLILHLHATMRPTQTRTRDESFLGYDFSEGYTSLDRTSPEWAESESESESGDVDQQDDFTRTGILERWKSRREEERQRREFEERQMEERQLDAILEKLHSHGTDSLTTMELHLLNRASQRLRQRNI